jgi:pyruvate kinase
MSGARARGRGNACRTKIVCTIGPATQSRTALARLAAAGMNVARFNFSYGTHDEYARVIGMVRALERTLGRPIGVLQDLSGFKLRVGALPGGAMMLRPRQEVLLSAAPSPDPPAIPIPTAALPKALSPGQRLLLGDGKIELRVLDARGAEVRCRVRVGGLLQSHQGLAAPDTALPIGAATRKDLADLRFGLEQGVDWVAMSFVRSAEDLEPLRRAVKRHGSGAGLMAKIERHEAIDNLDEIIDAADGIMVARGDLGIQLPLDQVPVLQKDIIARCNAVGKPVVTATQMLESMVSSPRPTRAEVSDVANAVLDGTDAVMLSAETAVGRYPSDAVRVMSRVCARAEAAFDYEGRLAHSTQLPCRTVTDGISQAVVSLASDLNARAIITATSSGHTALMVAMHRPAAPIVAVTSDVATQRRLTPSWGVTPLLAARGRNTDQLIVRTLARAREEKLVHEGDLVVITAGVPAGIPGHTNLIKVEVVGRRERA